MKDQEVQKELFKEFGDEGKRARSPHGHLMRAMSVAISLDRLVFIGIGSLMALVLIYALGVERGKAAARAEVKKAVLTKVHAKAQPAKPRVRGSDAGVEEPRAKKAPVLSQEGMPYTVLAATFRQRVLASQEAVKLKDEGYNAFLVEAGDYLELCVGRFAALEDAARLQKNLSTRYKKCYIKKLQ